MLKKPNTVAAGIVISATLFFACFATLSILAQISIKASAQNMTSSGSNGSGNASTMMTNKTAANSDVLMHKVRNMGIGSNTLGGGSSSSASSNMTNQTSG